MFEKLLCPVDFSECSELALSYALAIAKQHGALVAVMHVVPEALADPDVYPYLNEPVLPGGETRDRAYRQLGAFVHRALEEELATEVILEDGEVVREIVDKSARMPADLIVMGTHGRSGLSRLLLGSVTERVLRQANCPVLSVAPSAIGPHRDGGTFRRILCPVDFSPSSLRGLEIARALAGEEGEVTVVHVVEFYLDPGVAEGIGFDLEKMREHHRGEARAKLETLVPPEAKERTKLETVMLESGGPYRKILQQAERDRSDLIVMGVMGRSAADMVFFGSTTNHVVRAAGCPVLTVRAQE